MLVSFAALMQVSYGQSYHNYHRRSPGYCPPAAPVDRATQEPRVDSEGRPIEDGTDPALAEDFLSEQGAPTPVGAIPATGGAGYNSIGDHFGTGYSFGNGGDVPTAGGDRRVKITENTSPIPQDRFFFNFNHFHHALDPSDAPTEEIDLERYTLGLERTFFSGAASVEFRAPILDALNSDQNTAPGSDNEGVEFGNLTITPKALILSNCCWKVSAGMGIVLPTADDATQTEGSVYHHRREHQRSFAAVFGSAADSQRSAFRDRLCAARLRCQRLQHPEHQYAARQRGRRPGKSKTPRSCTWILRSATGCIGTVAATEW